jgi:SAM-dependent methyltransferase
MLAVKVCHAPAPGAPGCSDCHPASLGPQLVRVAELVEVTAGVDERLLGHVLGIGTGSEGARQHSEVAEERPVLCVEPLDVDDLPRRHDFHTLYVASRGPRLYRIRSARPALFRIGPAPYLCTMPPDGELERIRRIYDRRSVSARSFSRDPGCEWLCSQASGETLEIGIGRGRTLGHYPPGVRLTGLDLSGVAIGLADRRAAELGLDVTLRQGDAAALPYPDERFDTVVFCYALCTIPDDRRAVAEAVRVLRPGGRLLLIEHVRSPNRIVRAIERLVEPIELRRMGDHLVREPLDHVLAEGLEVETLERRMFGIIERLVALKPDDDELEQAG